MNIIARGDWANIAVGGAALHRLHRKEGICIARGYTIWMAIFVSW